MMATRVSALRMVVVAVAVAAGACNKVPPKRRAAPTQPLEPPAATSVVARPTPPAPNLDEFGNLRGTENRVLGFEVPMGSIKTGKGESRFVGVNEDRFVRFFRSRGYKIESLANGAHKITHTRRTLDQLSAEEAKRVEPAQVFVDPGPGPGYTMRYNRGVAPPQRDLLAELREAERQFDPEFKRAQAQYRQEQEARRRAEEAARAKAGAPAKKAAPTATGAAGVVKRRVYTPEDLQALRRRAGQRKTTPQSRAMQQKIRDWERKTGRTFMD